MHATIAELAHLANLPIAQNHLCRPAREAELDGGPEVVAIVALSRGRQQQAWPDRAGDGCGADAAPAMGRWGCRTVVRASAVTVAMH
jgi:hypothetical protein